MLSPKESPQQIAGVSPKRHRKTAQQYEVIPELGAAFIVHASGREAWTLDRLVEAGRIGVTPIERPAPRWSGYVCALRRKGVPIQTIREPHKGDYPGQHGRYVLGAEVRRV
jgi:hypothetical protein